MEQTMGDAGGEHQMRGDRESQHRHYKGQVLVIVAVGLIVLTGILAMSVDVGLLLSERRGAQNAADAASLAVAKAMLDRDGQDAGADEATIESYLEANGFEDAEFEWGYTSDPDGVLVDVQLDVPRVFLGALYDGDWSVQSEAGASIDTIPKDYALITLKESGPGVNLIGNVNIDIEGGGAMSNSSMRCNGNGELYAELTTDSHQGFTTIGNCEFVGGTGMNGSAPKVDDPLAGTHGPPKPGIPSGLSSGGCDRSGNTVTCVPGHYSSTEAWKGNLDIVFQPGTYHFDNADLELRGNISMTFQSGSYDFFMDRGDIAIQGNSSVDMDPHNDSDLAFYFDDSSITFKGNTSLGMASGIYYFDGDDFGVSGNQRISGDDVLLYFDGGSSFNHSGNAEFDLTASSTPLYSGMPENMLFFSAPGSASLLELHGNTGINFEGITYMPDGKLDFRGNPDGVWASGQVIVNEVEFRGNSNGTIEYQNYVEVRTPSVFLTQ